jgi:hypothetical protein
VFWTALGLPIVILASSEVRVVEADRRVAMPAEETVTTRAVPARA